MRRWFAIAKATVLEIFSEPLSLLLLISALVLAVLAPALHYHQFGEPTRMAREAGLSALFTFGTVFAIAGIYRSLRRELESGTAQMAMSHSVSRSMFLAAKFSGALIAYLFFAIILASVSFLMVYGALIGGAIAKQSGDISRVWGPALASGVGAILVPLMSAAFLNRFFRFRFVISSFMLFLVFSVVAALIFFDLRMVLRLMPVWIALFFPAAVFIAATVAFAVGFGHNLAMIALSVFAVVSVPAIGNYYLADSLSGGGAVPWGYVALAGVFALPAIAAFLVLAVHLFERRDIA